MFCCMVVLDRGKTSFLKHYLDQTKADYLAFSRDSTEFHDNRYVDLLQLENLTSSHLKIKQL